MKQNFIEDNIIIISKQTLDEFLKNENPSDIIGLYVFYYYTAKWQKTNIIKCSTGYVKKGLNWTKERVIKNKKRLIEIGLIEDKKTKNEKGQITGWYIKINYVWKKETIIDNIKNQRVAEPDGGLNQGVANPATNALSANSLNALSANSKNSKATALQTNEKEINDLISLFKEVNPSYQRLFGNKTQRSALERLVKQHGQEKIEWAIKVLPKTNKTKFAPVITTPYMLESKLGQLIAFMQKESGENNEYKVAKI